MRNRFKGLDLIDRVPHKLWMDVRDIVQETGFKTTAKKKKCKKIEENIRMRKTRDLVKKIRDTKGTFHAKMGSTTDRSGMDLTEEDIKKQWQEYTEELYKKDLHNPDNQDGVTNHLEPDILECQVGLRKHHYEQS